MLSEPLEMCMRRDCNELENYSWTEINNASGTCYTQDKGGWYYKPDAATCQTCVYVGDRTTTVASTLTATSTVTTAFPVPDTAVWEPVGPSGKSACRGRHINDNLATYYTVYSIESIEDCKALCVDQYPSCKGIEYSEGRCEIWTRTQGIYLSKELSGFTCLRFGWATQSLTPLDGGSDRACRGDHPTHNLNSFYSVSEADVLEDCKAQCSAAMLCFGIEFSLGRCEIWHRPVQAVAVRSGFSCFAFPSLTILP